MLGHKACQCFGERFDTHATFRRFDEKFKRTNFFDCINVLDNIDVFDFATVNRIVRELKPGVVLNAVGIVKQIQAASQPRISIYVNSLLPHLLAEVCEEVGARLIHISTDCVFSGRKGNYKEGDDPDPVDLYGRTKALGEVDYNKHLTIRTSIIGHELQTRNGLVEWFLSQKGRHVNGYINAIYSGLTTMVLCREVAKIIEQHPALTGTYHVSCEKITKFELLAVLNDVYALDIELRPDPQFTCDRSLDSQEYRKAMGFKPLSWEEMIHEMYQDYVRHYNWREN
jgi:dTDP-4-dehydrorhamnose reductase